MGANARKKQLRYEKEQSKRANAARSTFPKPSHSLALLIRCASLLFTISFVAHFLRLGHPSSVVFDEVHFGKFTTQYCCEHKNFFDIHPPHSKLLVAGAAYLGGYRGGFSFERIGQKYHATRYHGFRVLPALMGTLVAPLIFLILIQLGTGWRAAFLGGALALFDNGLLIQTRILALDGFLLVATLCTVSCLLSALKRPGGNWFFALAGMASAFAVGTKFTGLVTVGLIGLAVFYRFLQPAEVRKRRRPWMEALAAISVFTVVYLGGWWIHFKLVPLAGDGDAFYQNTGNFFADLTKLHDVMLKANNGLTKGHADTSPWWTWPFMLKPIYYWVESKAHLYFLGNPVTWIGATFIALFSMLELSRRWWTKETPINTWWIVGAGFWASLLPYAAVSRGLFLYHYLPVLQFAILATGFSLDSWMRSMRPERARVFFYGALVTILAGFLIVLPVTYGFKPTDTHKSVLQFLFPKVFLG